MRIIWKVEDGYVNPGPQESEISDDEFEDDMSEDDRRKVIDEFIQQEFENNISWYIESIDGH